MTARDGPHADATAERARAVDAAFDRGDPEVGTAVVELVLSGADFEVAAPRVERALRAEEETVRRLGQVAAGDLARPVPGPPWLVPLPVAPAFLEQLRPGTPAPPLEDTWETVRDRLSRRG
ncbi:hypothetical protein DN069_34305 [Streptacidiphilus pinicola]|uniref:Uncharacterized protein n=1 Tax=Streptacidiphilus pinicola TaxID=2219663 RepID=A0A2X0I8B2_9ACTN|nr:hypothetical protein [Streptacidiphilus pinicola]RAG81172.1 hypothetical protein DN069_34305 [Streptacidiphilus pinicola]